MGIGRGASGPHDQQTDMQGFTTVDSSSQEIPVDPFHDLDLHQSEVLETQSAAFVRLDPGVIVVKVKPVHITQDMSDRNLEVTFELADDKPWALVIDMVDLKSTDRSVRHKTGKPDRFEGATAIAVVAGNPLSRFLGNFLIRVRGPSRPTRIFAHTDAAVRWARGYLPDHTED